MARERKGRLTIEREHGETYSKSTFAVYEHGYYPRSSVLAGLPSRKYVDGGFESEAEAKAKYPRAQSSGSTFIPSDVMTRHLPDDGDGW